MKAMKEIKRSAFSLLEMLIAISLLALLMTLLFTVNNNVWKQWQQLEQQQKRASEVGLLFQKIIRDLRSAVVIPGSFFIDLPTTDPCCRNNLFFLASSSFPKTEGGLHAIVYFFVEEKNIPTRYECYRFMPSPQETHEALQNQNLCGLFAKASPSKLGSCQRIASGILAWKIQPAWVVDGKMSATPPQISKNEAPPSLLEISITTGDAHGTPLSKEPLTTRTFSTVVALPPAL
ncbi:MAG: prepilin-type N-terminal cleavage/methylation domain-containing protein [Chthoniobacterales bacterium]